MIPAKHTFRISSLSDSIHGRIKSLAFQDLMQRHIIAGEYLPLMTFVFERPQIHDFQAFHWLIYLSMEKAVKLLADIHTFKIIKKLRQF